MFLPVFGRWDETVQGFKKDLTLPLVWYEKMREEKETFVLIGETSLNSSFIVFAITLKILKTINLVYQFLKCLQ
jgi:hypothetical protein